MSEKIQPMPPELKAMMGRADEKEADERVHAAFCGTLEQTIDGALGLAVVAYSEAATTYEREQALRTAAALACTLHTIQIVIESFPPKARTPIQELFVRACVSEIQRHDAALRKALPEAEALRKKHVAAINEASMYCPACDRPYAPGELAVDVANCITANCDGRLRPASEVRL